MRRLPSSLADFVEFECALNDIGYGTVFADRKSASQIASFGATD